MRLLPPLRPLKASGYPKVNETSMSSEEIRAEEREECAKVAETFHHFGPSTQCPDCGSPGQVLRWYTLGRKEAAEEIRKRNKKHRLP